MTNSKSNTKGLLNSDLKQIALPMPTQTAAQSKNEIELHHSKTAHSGNICSPEAS